MTDSGNRDRAEGKLEELKGEGKQAWGDMTDDDRMKAEGKGDELKGKAEQLMGDIKNKADDLKEDVEKKM